MPTEYGVFAQIVASAGALLAAAGALRLGFKGRAKWEPSEEDVPQGAQKVGGLITAVAIGVLWYWFAFREPGQAATLTRMTLGLAGVTLLAFLVYGLLITVFTYEKIIALSPKKTKTIKIIGGFALTAGAKKLVADGKTVQQAFEGAAYDPDLIWPRLPRGLAKESFRFAYITLVAAGTSALACVAILVSVGGIGGSGGASLPQALDHWLAQAAVARQAQTVAGAATLPVGLTNARAAFESAWQNAGLAARRAADQERLSQGLSYVVRSYRLQEKDSPTQKNALTWAEAAIAHFEQVQHRRFLTEALLDQAAVFLDLAQLEHTNRQDFIRISQLGDATVTRAAGLAEGETKGEALRISSRFYYNLARPQSFRLSDAWDNNYLLLAYEKAAAARALGPGNISNENQVLRALMKISKNPPHDRDPAWRPKLREAKDRMKAAWEKNRDALARADQRLSPLNVLGTGTLELVALEWHQLPTAERAAAVPRLLAELEADGLSPLREARALLSNDALKRTYGFDLYYDLSRAEAQRLVMLRIRDEAAASAVFEEVKANLRRSREAPSAAATQIDAARRDLGRDLSFSKLLPAEKAALEEVLNGNV